MIISLLVIGLPKKIMIISLLVTSPPKKVSIKLKIKLLVVIYPTEKYRLFVTRTIPHKK